MNEQVEKIVQPVKSFWGKQSKNRKIGIVSILAGIVALAVIIVLILNVKQYVVLYGGVTQEEATEVLALLQQQGVDCKIQNAGTTILVDKKQEAAVRMQLATQGYPRSAPDYALIENNIDFMTTDSEKRSYKIYQLQERLQETIKTLDPVKNAIVTIVPPKDNGYVWEEESVATASVTLTLKSGVTLDNKQVDGVKRLVATAVEGLTTDSIAVIDAATSNELGADSQNTYVDIANFKLDIEKQLQKDIETNVMKLLLPLYGDDNVTVVTKSSLDLDKKIKEIITYTPSTEDEKGMLSEVEGEQEKIVGADGAGGVVGAEDNADLTNYVGITDDGESIYYRNGMHYSYLVNKTTEQITAESPELLDLTVVASVNRRHVELLEDEKEEIRQAVANASGVSPAKVMVLNTDFNNPDYLQQDIPGTGILQNRVLVISMSAIAVLLLIGLIIVLLINRKMKKKKAQEAEQGILEAQQLSIASEDMPNIGEDLKNVPDSKEQVLKKEIQDFSNKNPEIVAQLLRTWLKGDEG